MAGHMKAKCRVSESSSTHNVRVHMILYVQLCIFVDRSDKAEPLEAASI